MKKYPTLYTKDSTGATRIWWMDQDGDKFRANSGRMDGQIVTSEWRVAKAKNTGKQNATTGETQAAREVSSVYKKQLKTGYHEKIEDIDKMLAISPMLAKKYVDRIKKVNLASGNWVIQIKFNGNRVWVTKDGVFAREGDKLVSVPHIVKSLQPFFEKYPDAILDGELYNYELREQLNELSKLIRKSVNITVADVLRSQDEVRLYLYDGFNFGKGYEESAPYEDRKNWIDKNIIGKYDYVCEVKSYPVLSEDAMMSIYQTFLDDNQEGCMLRNIKAGYERKRSSNLLKHKPVDDDEGDIVDILEGDGNWSGVGKIIILKWRDKQIRATFKGSKNQAAKFLKEKQQWIGKRVTFIFNGFTGLGTPNYARMDINNCLK